MLNRNDYTKFMSIVSGLSFQDSQKYFFLFKNDNDSVSIDSIVEIYKNNKIFKNNVKTLKNLFRREIWGKNTSNKISKRIKVIKNSKEPYNKIKFPYESIFYRIYRSLFNIPPPYQFDYYLPENNREKRDVILSNLINSFLSKFFNSVKQKVVNRINLKPNYPLLSKHPDCNPFLETCVYVNVNGEEKEYKNIKEEIVNH